MANIFARSPYVIGINVTGQEGSKIEIYLWNGTGSAPTTPQYTLSKLIPSSTNTLTEYDISPYIREYLSHTAPQEPAVPTSSFTALATTQWCNVKVVRYKLVGGVYSAISFGTTEAYAFDGYTYYESGSNYDLGNYLLEQKKYYYNEDATYAGEVAAFLSFNQRVRYVGKGTMTITGVTVNVTSGNVVSISKSGRYILLPGEYLSFEYDDGVNPNAIWTGTVLTCVYSAGTGITTITPNFTIDNPANFVTGTPTNTGKEFTTLESEFYSVADTKWTTIPRVSGDLTKLQILSSVYVLLASWEFIPVCESKYTPVEIDFINQYGAWQKEFFFKSSKSTLAIESNDYNVMQSSVSSYDTMQGQKKSFNTNARETISVNSGFVNEDFSSNIKQLVMSERILVDGKPAICKTKSLEVHKSINTHMINYSLEFEFAYNTINSVI